MQKTPLNLDGLTELLDAIGGFEARPLIAVGVSGGPDSMALMLLADRWARQRGGAAWGLTVDHGLRPESAGEARTVAGWLAARAIRHDILAWTGEKPAGGIQAAAREARYGLMADWCRGHGCLHLLVAHQREDQIETHLIRRRAGSGNDGLAGMSAVRELVGCRLVRPLLSVPRQRLEALLGEEDQPFLSDPSNLNPVFERARLRLYRNIVPTADIFEQALHYGRQRIEREHALDRLIGVAVALHPAGFAVLDPAAINSADSASAEQLLGRVARTIGAARYPARLERLARLRAGLLAVPDRARTLGGCRFVPWRGRLLVLRELAAARPPVRLDPGACVVWDRRFAAEQASAAPGGFTLGYLGQLGASAGKSPMAPPIDRSGGDLPRVLHPVLPAFWDGEGLAGVPHLFYTRPGTEALPRVLFHPPNPFTSAGFTVV